MYEQTSESRTSAVHAPWNKGKLTGQKPPFTLKQIWAIRIRIQIGNRIRDLALFNLAIDSKLRGCDLVGLRVHDVVHGNQIVSRVTVLQRKEPASGSVAARAHQAGEHRPVPWDRGGRQTEIAEQTEA